MPGVYPTTGSSYHYNDADSTGWASQSGGYRFQTAGVFPTEENLTSNLISNSWTAANNAAGIDTDFEDAIMLLINKSDVSGTDHSDSYDKLNPGDSLLFYINSDQWYRYKILNIFKGSSAVSNTEDRYIFQLDYLDHEANPNPHLGWGSNSVQFLFNFEEKVGLDNVDLENQSLGNWNSIIKNNKVLPTGQANLYDVTAGSVGRPVYVEINNKWHRGIHHLMSILIHREKDSGNITRMSSDFLDPYSFLYGWGDYASAGVTNPPGPEANYHWNWLWNAGRTDPGRAWGWTGHAGSGQGTILSRKHIYGNGTFPSADDYKYSRPVAYRSFTKEENTPGWRRLDINAKRGPDADHPYNIAIYKQVTEYYFDFHEENNPNSSINWDTYNQVNKNEKHRYRSLKDDLRINFGDGFAYMQEREEARAYNQGYDWPIEDGNEYEPIEIHFDPELAKKMNALVYEHELPRSSGGDGELLGEGDYGYAAFQTWQADDGDNPVDYGGLNNWTHEVFFPHSMLIKNPADLTDEYVKIGGMGFGRNTELTNRSIRASRVKLHGGNLDGDENPLWTGITVDAFSLGAGAEMAYWTGSLGGPTFPVREDLDLSNVDNPMTASLESRVEFIVNTKTFDEKSQLVYYNLDDEKYLEASYPIKVELNMNLLNYPDHDNRPRAPVSRFDKMNYYYMNSTELKAVMEDQIDPNPEESTYYYQVVQWGDEDILLTDNDIENSYYFSMYDLTEFPTYEEDYAYKKQVQLQSGAVNESKPIEEIITHVYSTAGIKNIKIIVFRYTKNLLLLTETILVTKNIMVNEGNVMLQDFQIFGGTDFQLLPLKAEIPFSQAMIGGLDEHSKYNTSINAIVANDDFSQQDWLVQLSSHDFIDNFNSSMYGEHLGQVDLGINRVFKGPHDIYDFLNLKSNVMNQITGSSFPSFGSGFYTSNPEGGDISIETSKLEINSEATDIFINDNKNSSLLSDCLIELVPSEREYLTIPNEIGTDAKAILIGDYEVEQPAGEKISKKGIMKTSMLEENRDKQAF